MAREQQSYQPLENKSTAEQSRKRLSGWQRLGIAAALAMPGIPAGYAVYDLEAGTVAHLEAQAKADLDVQHYAEARANRDLSILIGAEGVAALETVAPIPVDIYLRRRESRQRSPKRT